MRGADLTGADLSYALVTAEQLAEAASLEGATMPNGQKYEDWLKSKGRGRLGRTAALRNGSQNKLRRKGDSTTLVNKTAMH